MGDNYVLIKVTGNSTCLCSCTLGPDEDVLGAKMSGGY